ncbi:hypothetical protein [Microcoleus sp. N3A4]|uniref:hypothetical protein n=1 Tax=Microcoleus sp. N3A4 TaxID=3055379 RepID=UPI002FCEDE4C
MLKIDKAILSTSPIALMHFCTLELPYIRHLPKLKSREARSHFNSVVTITDSNQLNKCNRGNRLNQHLMSPFPISLGNLVRNSIGNLRAMRLLNKSQQVRSNFVISLLYIYQGELSGFMQNSQVFFVKFCKHWWKYGTTGVFGI